MYIARKSVKASIAVYTTHRTTTWLIGLKCGEQIVVSWSASVNTAYATLIPIK
jgi:hypothetical protein